MSGLPCRAWLIGAGLLGIAGAGVVGCSDPQGPELIIRLAVLEFDPSQGSLPSDSAFGGNNVIVINGGFEAPCIITASQVFGDVRRDSVEVIFGLSFELGTAGCAAGISAFEYEAVLGPFDDGTYRIEVRHVWPGQGAFVSLRDTVDVS